MVGLEQNELAEAVGELEDAADGLDTISRRSAGDERTIRAGVEDGVADTLATVALAQAQSVGADYVGEYASEIRKGEGSWKGKTYSDGLVTDSEVVLAHEYGSGVHNDGSAYRIQASGGDGPLALETSSGTKFVEYVVHPGVEQRGFMAEAVDDSGEVAAERVLDNTMDRIEEAMR